MRILLVTLVTMGGLVLAMEFSLADCARLKKQVRREVEIDFVIPQEVRNEMSPAKRARADPRTLMSARERQARQVAWQLFTAPVTLSLSRLR